MSGIPTSLPNRIRPDEIYPDQTMDARSTGAPERLADRLDAAATSGMDTSRGLAGGVDSVGFAAVVGESP